MKVSNRKVKYKLEFIVISDFSTLRNYEEEWKKILLQNSNNNPFIEFEWVEYWWSHLGRYHELFVIMIRQDSQIAGFCPLMLTKKRLCTEVNFIGYSDICYMDLILNDEYRKESIDGLISFLSGIRKNYVFNIHGLSGNSEDFKLLRNCFESRRKKYILCMLQSFYADTSRGTFDDFYKSRCFHGAIKNIAKHEKKLHRLGSFTYKEINDENIDSIFEMHDKRWHKKNDGSSFSKGATREFFKGLTLSSGLPFRAKVGGLFLDDRLIAFQYSFVINRRFICQRICHDDTFAIYGPGRIMYKESIRECFEGDIDICEFGAGGYQRDKAEWTDNVEVINRIVFPTRHFASLFSFQVYLLNESLKNALRKYRIIQHIKVNTCGTIKYYLSKEPYCRLARTIAAYCSRKRIANLIQYFLYNKRNKDFVVYQNVLSDNNPANEAGKYRIEHTNLHDIERITELMHLKTAEVLRRLERGQRCAKLVYEGTETAWLWTDNSSLNGRNEQNICSIEMDALCIYDYWMLDYMKDRKQYGQRIKGLMQALYGIGYKKLYFVIGNHEGHIEQLLKQLGFVKVQDDNKKKKSEYIRQKAV